MLITNVSGPFQLTESVTRESPSARFTCRDDEYGGHIGLSYFLFKQTEVNSNRGPGMFDSPTETMLALPNLTIESAFAILEYVMVWGYLNVLHPSCVHHFMNAVLAHTQHLDSLSFPPCVSLTTHCQSQNVACRSTGGKGRTCAPDVAV
jgi:hypothetical protein